MQVAIRTQLSKSQTQEQGRSSRRMPLGWARRKRLILARDKGICGLCGMGGATSVDHIIPRSLGGSEDHVNLQAAHERCNNSKLNRIPTATPRRSRFG